MDVYKWLKKNVDKETMDYFDRLTKLAESMPIPQNRKVATAAWTFLQIGYEIAKREFNEEKSKV